MRESIACRFYRDKNGIAGGNQGCSVVSENPGVAEIDGGRPMDAVEVLSGCRIVSRVLRVSGKSGYIRGGKSDAGRHATACCMLRAVMMLSLDTLSLDTLAGH